MVTAAALDVLMTIPGLALFTAAWFAQECAFGAMRVYLFLHDRALWVILAIRSPLPAAAPSSAVSRRFSGRRRYLDAGGDLLQETACLNSPVIFQLLAAIPRL
jgi:hypothetical protein